LTSRHAEGSCTKLHQCSLWPAPHSQTRFGQATLLACRPPAHLCPSTCLALARSPLLMKRSPYDLLPSTPRGPRHPPLSRCLPVAMRRCCGLTGGELPWTVNRERCNCFVCALLLLAGVLTCWRADMHSSLIGQCPTCTHPSGGSANNCPEPCPSPISGEPTAASLSLQLPCTQCCRVAAQPTL
jgi:hypothetical protein